MHRYFIFLISFAPLFVFSQKQMDRKEYFGLIPYRDGQIIYERIITLDSINNKEQVFNSAKSALIKNTSYKYSKIDEDRIAGSISTEIRYNVTNNAAIRINIFATSILNIDVKENRFRIRIFNSSGKYELMGTVIQTTQVQMYESEQTQIQKGKKWKAENSYSVNWDLKVKSIINAFSEIISMGITDDF